MEMKSNTNYLHISNEQIDGFDIFNTQTDPIYYKASKSKIEGFNGYVYTFEDFLYLILRSDPLFSEEIVDLAQRNGIEKFINDVPFYIELRPLIRNIGSLVCFYHLYPVHRDEMEFHNKYHSSTMMPSEGTNILNDIRSILVPELISSPTN